ncbi:MAG: discoidin domain-containing protein, partial [Gluconacetobacter diazotrophicus]|nr:discoidin domain-containing protein [Gluconacetobacter diazotrophicus]
VVAPVVNSPANAVASVGAPFSYQVTAANAPTSFAASPLPAGLSFNTATGLLAGTPQTAATTVISLTATNDGGTSAAKTLSLAVSPAGADINLALNKGVTTLDPPIDGNVAAYAVDGSPGTSGTRWESPHSDTEWICVDLGATYPVHAVNFDWENACGQNYTVEVSNDGTTWTNFVAPVVGNKTAGWLYYNGSASARFVRMNGTLRATQYGYSMYEFQVMGPASPVAPPTGLAAGPGGSAGQVALSWNALAGAQTYTLQRSTDPATGFLTVATITAPAATYTDADPSLAAGRTYYYRLAATTAQGTSGYSAAVAGTPDVPPGVAGWRYQYFGAAGLNPTDANGASDNANPAHDGIPNLMKYALGLDPTVDYYAAGSTGMPTIQRQNVNGASCLTLTFTGTATDVTYLVQAAGTPGGPWTTLATYRGAAAVGTFTVSDNVPVGAARARFLRLQVTDP